MSARAFSSLRSKLFPRSSPNSNECMHGRSKSARTLIHELQRCQNKADGLYLMTPPSCSSVEQGFLDNVGMRRLSVITFF